MKLSLSQPCGASTAACFGTTPIVLYISADCASALAIPGTCEARACEPRRGVELRAGEIRGAGRRCPPL